jgi:DNA-binding XRE family transcriptional regulator
VFRRSDLDPDKVREIYRLLCEGSIPKVLAQAYGVTRSTIDNIATGRTWKHIITTRAIIPTRARQGLVGEHNGRAKLDSDKVLKIRRLSMDGATQKALAQQFGVTDVSIGNVLAGRTWAHVGAIVDIQEVG